VLNTTLTMPESDKSESAYAALSCQTFTHALPSADQETFR